MADLAKDPVDISHLLLLERRDLALLLPEGPYAQFPQVFGKVRHIYRLAVRKRNAPFDDVLELPHVSGEVVVHQYRRHVRRNLPYFLLHQGRIFLQEVVAQERYVVFSLRQGRDTERHDVQPEVKVPSEAAFLDHLLKVPVRGSRKPDIHPHRSGGAGRS